ncbi:MAG: hypothetical protein QOH43_3167 [Solirubrobacteraceae bacterium]|jgi:glucose/arabinose dehydrogenase|nr:hypothetical protein [Solirubrobacteraceae bacterium]
MAESNASPGRWARRIASMLVGAVLVLVLASCALTDPATSVTDTTATLNGRINPQGVASTWWFQYGTSTTYGSETPHRDAGAGNQFTAVSEQASGLKSGTAYHFRACTATATTSSCGADATFTTTGPPPPIAGGFAERVAFSGLTEPTAVRFSPDGRVFVAEKSGLIKVFDGLGDTTPTVFADLRTKVHNFWDRGLLGLALDPQFPARPFVYVLYTYDAAIGGTAPRWGTAGATSDGCPSPPGPTTDGCVVSGRLSRLTAAGNVATGPEQVLVEDWCQQFPSHSVGSLAFGPDGSLYASGGDGANFNAVDYGQFGNPVNPCDDPPTGVGTSLSPPSAEGGALRAQDILSPGDPAALNGSVIRIDPDTGEGLTGNPGAASTDRNVRRIVANGLRNPFRITTRPGTDEVWVGDVGWDRVEEINRLSAPKDATVDNFGWPCWEGINHQPGYESTGLSLCQKLYTAGTAIPPYLSYRHPDHIVPGETCSVGSSAIAGLAFGFYGGGPYPAAYDGALFFADHARNCIWVAQRGTGTLPSPSNVTTFRQSASNPVDLQVSPSGELFYVDFEGGTIRRIVYTAGNQPPVAVATADRTSGAVPLTVAFGAATSSDPDNTTASLTYAWDLDGDGQFNDSTAVSPSFTYTAAGTYRAAVRVTDPGGASATDAVTVTAGNTPPTAVIASPSPGVSWKVGDVIAFKGSAVDEQDGALPPSALSWSLIMHHCPSNCHTHPLQTWDGTDAGSFATPDHEYPSYLELRLTATDAGGLTDTQSMRLDPRTVALTLASSPSGLTLALGPTSRTTPFTTTVIEGSLNSITAPSPQTLGGTSYSFRSWSDGGAAAHSTTASADKTLTATYGSP